MKLFNSLLLIALMTGSTLAQAQLYKWVGPDGKVTYSDVPPPSSAKGETKNFGSPNAGGANLPYELAQAVKNSPVTLYSGDQCAPCDEGRKFLKARGVPFSEKTVSSNADIEKLREVGGDAKLPLLVIGRSKQKGFGQSEWSSALTAAGYPESSKLPASYRFPQPASAAPDQNPAQAKPSATDKPGDTQQRASQPDAGNAPPGFRF